MIFFHCILHNKTVHLNDIRAYFSLEDKEKSRGESRRLDIERDSILNETIDTTDARAINFALLKVISKIITRFLLKNFVVNTILYR